MADIVLWLQNRNKEGRSYFFNTVTKESTWLIPQNPNDWIESEDKKTKRTFYHNPYSGKSLWNLDSVVEAQEETKEEHCMLKPSKGFVHQERHRDSHESKGDSSVYTEEGWEAEVKEDDASVHSGVSVTVTQGTVEGGIVHEALDEKAAEEIGKMKVDFFDYVIKLGGGTSMFGRTNWKRRFLVVVEGKMGFFRSHKEFLRHESPLKGRWIDLLWYRLEESVTDPFMVRLWPINRQDRIWSVICDDMLKKEKLVNTLRPAVYGDGYVKSLHKALLRRESSRTTVQSP